MEQRYRDIRYQSEYARESSGLIRHNRQEQRGLNQGAARDNQTKRDKYGRCGEKESRARNKNKTLLEVIKQNETRDM
jgi:hypothetical protein